ncbi:MAG: hypothetical protein AB7P12_15145, partial [Alphaproteobacteria bacterium]
MSIASRALWFLGRLRVQFTLYVAALLVVFTVLVLAINWRSQEQIVLDRLDAHVQYVAGLTIRLLRNEVAAGDMEALAASLDDIVELEDVMAVAVVSTSGTVLAAARGNGTPSDFAVAIGEAWSEPPWVGTG